jgi:hypothetical protein
MTRRGKLQTRRRHLQKNSHRHGGGEDEEIKILVYPAMSVIEVQDCRTCFHICNNCESF